MNELEIRRAMVGGKKEESEFCPPTEVWYYASAQATLFDSSNVLTHTFADGKGILTFANEVNKIFPWLRGNSGITKIVMPETAKGIEPYAFREIDSFSIVIGPNVWQGWREGTYYEASYGSMTYRSPNASVKVTMTETIPVYGNSKGTYYIPDEKVSEWIAAGWPSSMIKPSSEWPF